MSASSSAVWRFLKRGCDFRSRRRLAPRRNSRLIFAFRNVFTGESGACSERCNTSRASFTSATARSDALSFFMTVMEPGRARWRARVHYLLYLYAFGVVFVSWAGADVAGDAGAGAGV